MATVVEDSMQQTVVAACARAAPLLPPGSGSVVPSVMLLQSGPRPRNPCTLLEGGEQRGLRGEVPPAVDSLLCRCVTLPLIAHKVAHVLENWRRAVATCIDACMSVCVCVRARVLVHVRKRVCVRACVFVCVVERVRMQVHSRAIQACVS